MNAGKELNLVADLGVGGEIFGLAALTAEAFGGLALGGKVFGLDPLVHQPGRFERDGLAELGIRHPRKRRYEAHQCGAGLFSKYSPKGSEKPKPTMRAHRESA